MNWPFLLLASWLISNQNSPEPIRITGRTMGTSYHITYFDPKERDLKKPIDELLLSVNRSISNYDPESEVSAFNQSAKGIGTGLPHLMIPLRIADEVYRESKGAFDLTVMPLVNVWGFGPGKALEPDKKMVDSIRSFTGFNLVQITADSITKLDPRVQLDFGGIGQGYGADVVADFLRSKDITNFLVELGGEGVASGKNLKSGSAWRVGILDPNSTLENQFFKAYVSLTDKSFTTAGNYFNYREIDGKKYSHTIDPSTGYPADRGILSASVFAKDCVTADAWDTAFMVMGHIAAIELLKKHPELQALLLYTDENGEIQSYVTPGISPHIILEP